MHSYVLSRWLLEGAYFLWPEETDSEAYAANILFPLQMGLLSCLLSCLELDIINTSMRTISCFVDTKINCWRKKTVYKVVLIPISVSLLMDEIESVELNASSYTLFLYRGSHCCVTTVRHVFVWWDSDIQEIPRRSGEIQTLRTWVPKPWVQLFWMSHDYYFIFWWCF